MSTAEQLTLSLTEMLAEFVAPPASEEACKLIARWTKYERAADDLFPINLGEDLSVVAIRRPTDGAMALVLRSLEEQVPLEGGKTFNVYTIDGLKPVESLAEAKEAMGLIRRAYDQRVVADVDGFGAVPAESEAAEADEVKTW